MTTVTTKLLPLSEVKSTKSASRIAASSPVPSSSQSASSSSSRKVPKESACFHGSYKLKNTNVALVESDNTQTTTCNLPEDATKFGWKSSKIFSRTISSIEVIRAMKSKSSSPASCPSANSSSNQSEARESPARESNISTAASLTSSSNPISPHSLSANQSVSKSPTESDDQSSENNTNNNSSSARRKKAVKEWKILKNKLASLRKKTTLDDNQENDSDPRRSPGSKGNSAKTSRSGSQDEGIVCRREDLIQLLYEAAKMAGKNSEKLKAQSPTTSPSRPASGKLVFKTATVSSSIETPQKIGKKSALKANPSFDSKIETNEKVGFVETKIIVPPLKSALKQQDPNVRLDRYQSSRSGREAKGQSLLPAVKEAKKDEKSLDNNVVGGVTSVKKDELLNDENRNLVQSRKDDSSHVIDKGEVNEEEILKMDEDAAGKTNSAAPVKWDESNVVDAMMLGDAIQAFLRGMGSSSPPATEKRVLFKRNS